MKHDQALASGEYYGLTLDGIFTILQVSRAQADASGTLSMAAFMYAMLIVRLPLKFPAVMKSDESKPDPQRPLKRSRSCSLSKSIHATPNKGKGKEIINQDISQVLSELEDEMTCPMYAAVSPLG